MGDEGAEGERGAPRDEANDGRATDEAAPSEKAGAGLFGRARQAREQAAARAQELANRANELKEQAAARAGELADQATNRAGELKDQAATRAGEVKDQVAARAAELKDAGIARVAEMLDDFNAAVPVIREAGYGLLSVEVQVGIPPKVVARFSAPLTAPEKSMADLATEHADNKVATLVLRALEFQSRIKFAGLKPSGMEVELGLSPHVTVRFS